MTVQVLEKPVKIILEVSNAMGSETSKPPFQLIAGHPTLDFVNTLDSRFETFGPVELLKSYDDLLRFIRQSELLPPEQEKTLARLARQHPDDRILQSCIRLRETIADCLYSALDGGAPKTASLSELEKFYRSTRSHQSPAWREGHLEWRWTESKPGLELPLWILTLNAWSLLRSPLMKSVRACGNPTCRWLFLDTSKNHTRRWCDMKICVNRMKGRRFRSQQRSPANAD